MPKDGYRAVRWLRVRPQDQRGGQRSSGDGLTRQGLTMASLADDHLEHLLVVRYSADGIESRRKDLTCFLVWAEERDLLYPEQITRTILESYQRWLWAYRKRNGMPLGVSTQRLRLSSVLLFFRWLCKQRLLEANPAGEVELPRPEKRLPVEALTVSEVEAVLARPNIGDPLGIRDRAILELFYSTGVRRSELARLEVVDLNREKRLLRVRRGKGGKDRVVPVGARALAWVEKYLDDVRPLLVVQPGEPGLFLSGYGEPFNPDVLGRNVSRYIADAAIGRQAGAHLLRHTCATHLLEGGADIRYIQQLLGHEKLETTAIYTEVSIVQLQAVHARCHPAERSRPRGSFEDARAAGEVSPRPPVCSGSPPTAPGLRSLRSGGSRCARHGR